MTLVAVVAGSAPTRSLAAPRFCSIAASTATATGSWLGKGIGSSATI
jgi:hypothetical protein